MKRFVFFCRNAAFPLLFFILIPVLSSSSYAHAGRTDEDGGHIDYETGEYHYHHGYPAHAHYDMDGDGDIDCPYDFVDQTNYDSGTSSGSGSSILGNGDQYESGYSDGYKKGYADGEEHGYTKGYADGEKYGYTKGFTKAEDSALIQSRKDIAKAKESTFWLTSLFTFSIFGVVTIIIRKKHNKRIESLELDLSKNNLFHKKQRQELDASHASEINKLNAAHAEEVNALNFQHRADLSRLKTRYELTSKYSENTWQKRYDRERQNSAILKAIISNDTSNLHLPDDVTLEPFFTPIKGYPSKEYPYGEYTVFLAKSGRRYHSRPHCIPDTKPYHYFDIIAVAEPCTRCVKPGMYPSSLPEWAKHLRKNSEQSIASTSPQPAKEETRYLMEAANGMLIHVPESRLESWQAAQDELKNNPDDRELTPSEKQLVERMVRSIYGPNKE